MFNQFNQYGRPQYSQPYGQSNRAMGTQAPYYNQFAPSTNKSFVQSLEDALSRPADFNSEMVYFDANRDVMYNVCTNGQGQKSYTILDIAVHTEQNNNTVSATSQADTYEARLKNLEKKMEELYGKYNAKQTDPVGTGNAAESASVNQ